MPESPITNAGFAPLSSTANAADFHGVVVPIPTKSVAVVSRTTVPSSVHPPAAERVTAPHTMAPAESVVKAFVPEQLGNAKFIPPALTFKPPANVDVADPVRLIMPELRITPPVRVRPLVEESDLTASPPRNVDVPL